MVETRGPAGFLETCWTPTQLTLPLLPPPAGQGAGTLGNYQPRPGPLQGLEHWASLFTYLGPHRGSGKGNSLSRFLRRDHICSQRKLVLSGIWRAQ